MEYLTKQTKKDGTAIWRFRPPWVYLCNKVAQQGTFRDGRTAYAFGKRQHERIKLFREKKIAGKSINDNSSMYQLVDFYKREGDFITKYKPRGKEQFEREVNKFLETELDAGYKFGDVILKRLKTKHIMEVERKLKDIPHESSKMFLEKVFDWHLINGNVAYNPFKELKRVKTPKKTIPEYWTQEEVFKLLDEAYKHFEYRSFAIATHLSYNTAQTYTTLLKLKWSDLDLDKGTLNVRDIDIPLDDTMIELLKKQQEDYSFQEYVLPHLNQRKEWRPMKFGLCKRYFEELREELGIREELKLIGIRYTAIKEMLEEEANIFDVARLTGLGNNTLTKMKHRLDSKVAIRALNTRSKTYEVS